MMLVKSIATGSMITELTATDESGIRDATGKYSNYFFPLSFDVDGIVSDISNGGALILPQGDLFPVFTNGPAASNDQEAFFTDVVVL